MEHTRQRLKTQRSAVALELQEETEISTRASIRAHLQQKDSLISYNWELMSGLGQTSSYGSLDQIGHIVQRRVVRHTRVTQVEMYDAAQCRGIHNGTTAAEIEAAHGAKSRDILHLPTGSKHHSLHTPQAHSHQQDCRTC